MANTMTGARGLFFVDNQLIGVYDSVNYSITIGEEPIHILGRFSPAEICETSYEAVNMNCSGFRVINNGVHRFPKVPKLQDLLGLEGVTITIVDRQTDQNILTAIGCKATSYGVNMAAKGTARINVSYLGMRMFDEEGEQDELGTPTLTP